MNDSTIDTILNKFIIKWNGGEYTFDTLDKNCTVLDLKVQIEDQTNVLVTRQKILGLIFNGKL